MSVDRNERSTNPTREGLFTDLYQLTMAQAYSAEGMQAEAVFELFFRELPDNRNYIVAAGLLDVVEWLESFRLTEEDIEFLRDDGRFAEDWLERLRHMEFSGEVWAVPEGTVVFGYEPLVQVVAPIVQAQIVETWILNQVHYQSVAATKAARVVDAAEGRNVVDFGSRRAHGADAALKAARAAWLAGAGGSSNVLAGKLYGIPVFGTMAHSYVQAHDSEEDAFLAFASEFPESTLLVDTYDTLEGIRKVIRLARESHETFTLGAVRLDSGDLRELAGRARRLLDEAGMRGVEIFASSGLNEYEIRDLLAAGAPIDGFGVGTDLVVSPDAPDLDMAYKLVEYDRQPRTKLSSDKVIYPGRKQVHRRLANGTMVGDVLGLFGEDIEGDPLLQPVLRGGRRVAGYDLSLKTARKRCREDLARLPERLRSLERTEQYPVEPSRGVRSALERLRRQHAASDGPNVGVASPHERRANGETE